jgi:hypothetical protein
LPYRGGALALNDLIGGQLQVMFDTMPESIGFIRAGVLRPLAVTSTERASVLPDVPTIGDFVPGYEASAWYGIGAPRNTPAEIVDALNREINAGLADPKIKARLVELGGTLSAGSPAAFEKFIADDAEKWAKVIKFAGVKSAVTPSDRRFALEHEAVEVAALAHVVVGVGLMHDAAVVPQHPVAMTPLVTVLVFFLRGVPHQLVDQRQRLLVVHADDGFHAHRIEEQRLAAVLGVGAHQRVDAGRRQLAATLLGDLPERARAIFALIDMNRLEPIDSLLGLRGQVVIGVVHIDVLRVAAA